MKSNSFLQAAAPNRIVPQFPSRTGNSANSSAKLGGNPRNRNAGRNAGTSGNSCNLPVLSCGGCGGCEQCCPVQVGLPFTAGCIPDNNANIQVNSQGVCVTGVDLGCASPSVSIIDSCAGNMVTSNIIANGETYNTNICNNQPAFAIPGVYCNTCNQPCTACACKPKDKKWVRVLGGQNSSQNPQNTAAASKTAVPRSSSSSSRTSSSSSSSSSSHSRSSSSSLSSHHPTAGAKQSQQSQQSPHYSSLRSAQPLSVPRRPNTSSTITSPPKPIQVSYDTGPGTPQVQDFKASKTAGCSGNTCSTTCPNPCPNCGGCICPSCNLCVNNIHPCNCNFIAVNIGETFQCNTCGSQTTVPCAPCPCTCSNCGTGCVTNPCCANCTCGTCCGTTCGTIGGSTGSTACASKPTKKVSFYTCDSCLDQLNQEDQKSSGGSQGRSHKDHTKDKHKDHKYKSNKSHKKHKHHKHHHGSMAGQGNTQGNTQTSDSVASCNCPNSSTCGGCPGNCNLCPFGCQNSTAVVTNACTGIDATMTQIAANPCGSVPCPPVNPVFCQAASIPSSIDTWYQNYCDFLGISCFGGPRCTSVPLTFQQAGYLAQSAPSTGVLGVAVSASGFIVAVAYETGNNQYAGIDIYMSNAGTFNKVQTIVPMPTDPQCGTNCCAAFNISMSFSDTGQVFTVGMPNLGPCGTVFIFQLCGCTYSLSAEIQPAAQTGPNCCNMLFGYCVWTSGQGQRVVIGSPVCNGNCGNGCVNNTSGSIVTFRPDVACAWTQEQVITPVGNNTFTPYLVNGTLSNANPYQLYANNPSGYIQPSFGRSVATDVYSNNIVVGSNNTAFVYGNINPNFAAPGAVNFGAGNTCGANSGPFELIATLTGIPCTGPQDLNRYDQGLEVAISGDGLTVASLSIAGSQIRPVIPATVFIFRRYPQSGFLGSTVANNAYVQEACITSLNPYFRAGLQTNAAGLYLSFDGSYLIAADPNASSLGGSPDGAIFTAMRTAAGWINQDQVTAPIPNSYFGQNIAVNRGLTEMFVTSPTIANNNGSTGSVMMYQ